MSSKPNNPASTLPTPVKGEISWDELVIDLLDEKIIKTANQYTEAAINKHDPFDVPDVILSATSKEMDKVTEDARKAFKILRASDLAPANEQKLLDEHKAFGDKKYDPKAVPDAIIEAHNTNMLKGESGFLARELATAYLNNKALAEFTTPERLDALSKGGPFADATLEFVKTVKSQPEFQGAAGQKKLNDLLKKSYIDAHSTHYANTHLSAAVNEVLEARGVPHDKVKETKESYFKITGPKGGAVLEPKSSEALGFNEIVIDEKKLAEVLETVKTAEHTEFKKQIAPVRQALIDRAVAHNARDPFAPGMTEEKARKAFQDGPSTKR